MDKKMDKSMKKEAMMDKSMKMSGPKFEKCGECKDMKMPMMGMMGGEKKMSK